MHAGKPIIGLAGGIGSGKSYVASLFGEEGCCVINSDALVSLVYQDEMVKRAIGGWWGPAVFGPAGEIDRAAVARKIFERPEEKRRLEGLIHPLVADRRRQMMDSAAGDGSIVAYVWDTPLLFETSLNTLCDAVVFVDAPLAVRSARVSEKRGWAAGELARRENSQLPLDKKRAISDYVIANTADEAFVRGQVRDVLSRVIVGPPNRTTLG